MSNILGLVRVAAVFAIGVMSSAAVAHQTSGANFPHTHSGEKRVIRGEIYTPTIWVDPDGCEHWVMDDGWEGFMTPKLDRQGRPSCNRASGTVCNVMSSDALFATASARLSASAQQQLRNFFATNGSNGFIITGHTDSRGSDGYNMNLSINRAQSVARVARSAGANIVDVRGEGERRPVASNATRSGMAQNRRVEISCVN